MALTVDDIVEYRTDLLSYCRYMFHSKTGGTFKLNWHQEKMCEALERVIIGDINRLVINIPPRSGKTEIAVVNFISWCLGNFPDSEFIHASYSKRLATNNAYNVRETMRHDAFSSVFPDVQIRNDSGAKDEFRTEQGGVVYATGAEGSITGRGAGKMREMFGGAIIIDDPHKPGEATSEIMRQNVIDWFSTTMESRKNNVDTPIILIMQRLHEEDLSGFLLSGGNGEHWHHVNIPAMDDYGSSFWPEQFPLDDLKRKESANSYVFAGQYMQQPAPKGGGLFKDTWWQWYDDSFKHPEYNYRVIYADTALKTGQENDYSVFQCWGYHNGHAYLIDQLRGKWEAPELIRQARAFWQKHLDPTNRGYLQSMKVEDKASGTGLIQTLKMEGVPVIGVQRSKDKYTRAVDVLAQIEAGLVHLPSHLAFTRELVNELSIFPNGKHDDQVDPLIDAITENLVSGYNLSAWG